MADTVPRLTGSSSDTPRVRRKRCKVSFSCTNCRQSKQRCDRQQPCSSCIRRGRRDLCNYEEGVFDLNQRKAVGSKRPFSSGVKYTSTPDHNLNFHIPTEVTVSSRLSRLSASDLHQFGYSKSSFLNPAGILKMLDSHDNFKDATLKSMPNREVCLIGNLRQSYLDLIDMLPPENYAEILINNYFTEYNWHYTILDRNVFTDHLEEFYLELAAIRSFGKVSFSLDTLYFPALMLELLAVSLKFLPSSYDRRLDSLLNGRSASEWSTDYNNSSAEIQECLGRYNASFISVQASFLRVVWLKVNSQVTESWRALGGVIKESEDMGLHQEGGTREFSNAEDACGHAWSEEIRRRFMLNLFLWDSGMAAVLGKSAYIKFETLSTLPTDTSIPRNRKTSIPLPRKDSQRPDTFTMRLVEYAVQKHLPKIRQLEEDGPYPKDYAVVEQLHQSVIDFIEALPAIFRFQNPDRSFDVECPWLIPQREYLCSTTWCCLISIHRIYIFSIRKSRSEVVKCGIQVLKAQQRFFKAVDVHQYKQFTLAFLTFEAAVTMLAVLIAYPAENDEFLPEAFSCLHETICRLQCLSPENALARSGAPIIQTLVTRAKRVRNMATSPLASKVAVSVDGVLTPELSHESQSLEAPDPSLRGQDGSASGVFGGYLDTLASPSSSLNQHSIANSRSLNTEPVRAHEAPTDSMDYVDEADFGYLIHPLAPTADLVNHEIVAATEPSLDMMQLGYDQNLTSADPRFSGIQMSLGASPESLPPQFNGAFPDHTFWDFINQGL